MERVITILCMALVTYLPRALPLMILKGSMKNEILVKWLSFIPSAILSSLLISSILIKDSEVFLAGNIQIIAIIPTILVALRTKSLILTVLAGVFSYFILSRLLFFL
jgi:branched-subunit amino acid transport protein